jgi:hypothetical protein
MAESAGVDLHPYRFAHDRDDCVPEPASKAPYDRVMNEYGVRDLAHAMVAAHRWRNAAPELRDYHVALLRALRQALGATSRDDSNHDGLQSLLDDTVSMLAGSMSPFSQFLEAPEAIVSLYQRHGQTIAAAANDLSAALTDLLTDVITVRYGIPPDRVVPGEELRQFGFDPTTPVPDPLDFW